MKKKIEVTILLLLMVCFLPPNVKASEPPTPVMDEKSFLEEFFKALESKDKAKIEELVRSTNPIIVFKVIISQSNQGITIVAQGKDAKIHFNIAEVIATIYAKEFKKDGLLELVKRNRLYTQEMCKEKLKGDDLIEEGLGLYEKSKWREAQSRWVEALKIYQKLGDAGESGSLGNIGNVYYSRGQYKEALDYHRQSLEIKRWIGDVAGESSCLMNILLAYCEEKRDGSIFYGFQYQNN